MLNLKRGNIVGTWGKAGLVTVVYFQRPERFMSLVIFNSISIFTFNKDVVIALYLYY